MVSNHTKVGMSQFMNRIHAKNLGVKTRESLV